MFVAYGSPANAAMFKVTDNNLSKCYFYFSPGAVKIAGTLINSYGGAACERPPRTAAFIVGDADARQSLLR